MKPTLDQTSQVPKPSTLNFEPSTASGTAKTKTLRDFCLEPKTSELIWVPLDTPTGIPEVSALTELCIGSPKALAWPLLLVALGS